MTNEEKIAVGLLGFKPREAPKGTSWDSTKNWYETPGRCYIQVADGKVRGDLFNEWPDLTDWNTIRRCEDVIAERRWWGDYTANVSEHSLEIIKSYRDANPKVIALPLPQLQYLSGSFVMGRATAEQRVAAFIRLLEERG